MSKKERVGEYAETSVAGERVRAYIPRPLPPSPVVDLLPITSLLEKASVAVGRLDGMSSLLPDIELFLYMYIRKEAVMSSQIEGTQSSLSDLLMYENEAVPGVPEHDVIEVSNYVRAMEHGLMRLNQGFPLCLRLIREIHEILLGRGRGSAKQPGEFRRSQNWIGGTRPGNARFVPPPPEKLQSLLGELEAFFHDEQLDLPVLVQAALAHVQFETIHPFLDGNGRLGRLLITFMLCVNGVLNQPLLYLSLFFKTHRKLYYDHLQAVRETGDWESWIAFFLEGVSETANEAMLTAQQIIQLLHEDREKIAGLGRLSTSVLAAHGFLEKQVITDVRKVAEHCKLSIPTAAKAMKQLEQLNIVREVTGGVRFKMYVYDTYLNILNHGIGEN
jgi:Fic family protein